MCAKEPLQKTNWPYIPVCSSALSGILQRATSPGHLSVFLGGPLPLRGWLRNRVHLFRQFCFQNPICYLYKSVLPGHANTGPLCSFSQSVS